jgi:hypothetical protein
MGIACTMAKVLQKSCTAPPPPPPPDDGCFLFHPDDQHHMTWIVDECPVDWVMPVTFEYSDGHTEVSADGTDAHEFELEGIYEIRGTDAEGRTCSVTVEVPT